MISLHAVRNPRFASFRTQPLENLSAAVKLPINKKVSGRPNPWNKSWIVNYCYANWVYIISYYSTPGLQMSGDEPEAPKTSAAYR